MEPTEIILSFVISYIAGIIPTEWFSNHKSMKEKLELCFNDDSAESVPCVAL